MFCRKSCDVVINFSIFFISFAVPPCDYFFNLLLYQSLRYVEITQVVIFADSLYQLF